MARAGRDLALTMIRFNVAGFLTDFTGGLNQIAIEGPVASVGEALTELWKLHPGLRDRVVNEQGQLRQHVNVFLDSENVRRKQSLETKVADGSELTILPSVSGGNG
jgi:molybdopterin synthase sulfur carrier subunit